MDDVNFYSNLPPLHLPLTELFHEHHFSAVPLSWHVIVSDVKNSTGAVSAGKHNDVNLVAAGSLIAALNIARRHKIEIPFFFGGDGSTMLVPQQLLKEVLGGLAAHNSNTKKNFGLEMHTGSVSLKEIRDSGHEVKIARLEIDAAFSKAVVIGDGLRYAEQKIKGTETIELNDVTNELNLTGLECRWNKIRPSAEEAVNVCYLIEAVRTEGQLSVYAAVFQKIEEVFGDAQNRNPLSTERLRTLLSFGKIKKEMLAKMGRGKPLYFINAFARTFFGKLFFRYNWKFGGFSGNEYLQQLIAHADTLTVDGRINTIVCSTAEKHNRFLDYLSQQERDEILVYGHHESKESIMTCYIENRNDRHIHFVDGADGGYTEAAKEFKSKLRKTQLVNGGLAH